MSEQANMQRHHLQNFFHRPLAIPSLFVEIDETIDAVQTRPRSTGPNPLTHESTQSIGYSSQTQFDQELCGILFLFSILVWLGMPLSSFFLVWLGLHYLVSSFICTSLIIRKVLAAKGEERSYKVDKTHCNSMLIID